MAGPAKLNIQLIMQVHDELVLEVPDGELAEAKEKLRTDAGRGQARGAR